MRFKKTASGILAGCLLFNGFTIYQSEMNDLSVSAENARVSVHDPSIIKLDDGSYYIIGSHLGAASSKDLQNWYPAANSNLGSTRTTFFKNIYADLAIPEKWSNTSANYDLAGNMWAPDIVWNPQMKKYCMYLSVNGVDWHSSIVLCTADNVNGPYTYVDTIVYSGFETNPANPANSYKNTDAEKVLGNNPDLSRYLDKNGRWNAAYGTNAIDPAVFYDESGNLWMVYGSWFGGIYMLELDEKTGLRDYNVKYAYKQNESDPYLGTHVAGGNWASGEGPYIEYMKDPDTGKGYYYLFLSYGYFNSNGGYNMRIFRSDKPNGPYLDQNGNSAIFPKGGDNIGGNIGQRLMSNYQWSCNNRPFKAQGHNSVLMDDDGKLFVIYHTKFDDAFGAHEVRVHQMVMNEDGWPTASAYEYTGEDISENGHSAEAVTGEYEFIFHTLNQKFVNEQSADVEKPKNIKLNENGTVSGDIEGTWTMNDGSADMSIRIGNVTYKGAFLVQKDESSKQTERMTFTATGNNTCVWGSKKSEYNASEDSVDLMNYNSSLVYNPDSVKGTSENVRIGETDILSGVSYTIRNKNSNLLLDLENGNNADGTNIRQWEKLGLPPQEWRIVSVDESYCKIISMVDESKCLTVENNSGEDGTNISLAEYKGSDGQLWKLLQDGSYYALLSKCSDAKSALDVFEISTENGANINQWEYWGGDGQLWKIEAVKPSVNDGEYTVRNLNSGLYLAGKSGNALQSAMTGWTFKNTGNNEYMILDEKGLALEVENGSAEDGANIALSENKGTDSQKFLIRANKDGTYSITTKVSGGRRCLDVYEISKDDGANICQWEFWGGDGQKFILEPVAKKAEKIKGDVNADGRFNITDVILLQKWMNAVPDTKLADRDAADLNEDGRINVFDLMMMKSILILQK